MKLNNNNGFTLIELLIVVTIIAILGAIAGTAYIGTQRSAARSEAYANLQNLRLLEEQFFAENARYTNIAGLNCAKDNPGNVAFIQVGGSPADPTNQLPGFRPGNAVSYSYCIEQNIDINGTGQIPCFRARAFGNTGTRVADDEFRIDCNNNRTF